MYEVDCGTRLFCDLFDKPNRSGTFYDKIYLDASSCRKYRDDPPEDPVRPNPDRDFFGLSMYNEERDGDELICLKKAQVNVKWTYEKKRESSDDEEQKKAVDEEEKVDVKNRARKCLDRFKKMSYLAAREGVTSCHKPESNALYYEILCGTDEFCKLLDNPSPDNKYQVLYENAAACLSYRQPKSAGSPPTPEASKAKPAGGSGRIIFPE